MDLHEIFTFDALVLWIPVFVIGAFTVRLGYVAIVNALLPYKEMDPDVNVHTGWIADERRKLEDRRSSERREQAKAAYLRGDKSALSQIGRRRCDFEAVGLPFPGDISSTT